MSATDPWTTNGLGEDHCLVHQFIRLQGRRPSREELANLQSAAKPVVSVRRRRAAVSAVRRRVGTLIAGRRAT